MGVHRCSSIIKSSATPMPPAELLRMATAGAGELTGGRAALLIDANGMAFHLNRLLAEAAQSGVADLLLRPTLPEVASAVVGLISGLRHHGIEPIFVADGATGQNEADAFKQLTWYRRSVSRACKDAAVREFCVDGATFGVPLLGALSPAFGTLDTGSLLRGGIQEVMAEVCAAQGATWLVCEQEADPVIASLARATGAIGILAEDSDFAMFRDVRYLPLSLNDGLLTNRDGSWVVALEEPWQVVTAEAVASVLGVKPDTLPLVAALTGNDFTKPVLEITGAHTAMALRGPRVGPADVAGALRGAAPPGHVHAPHVDGVPVPPPIASALQRWPDLRRSVDAAVAFYRPSPDLGPAALTAHRDREKVMRGGGQRPLLLPRHVPAPHDPAGTPAWRRALLQALHTCGIAPCDSALLRGIKWERAPLDSALDGLRLHQLPLLMHLHGCALLLRRVSTSPEAVLRVARRTRSPRLRVSAGDAIAVLETAREAQVILPAWSRIHAHDVVAAVAAAAREGDGKPADAVADGGYELCKGVTIPFPVGAGPAWRAAGADSWSTLLAADPATRARATSCFAHVRALANAHGLGTEACPARAQAIAAWHDAHLAALPPALRALALAACALCTHQYKASVASLPRETLSPSGGSSVVAEGDLVLRDDQRARLFSRAGGRTPALPTPTLALAEHELVAIAAAAFAARACDPANLASALRCGADDARCFRAAADRVRALALPVDFRPRLRALILARAWRHQVGVTARLAALLAVPDSELPPISAAWQLATTVLHWLLDAVARARARFPDMPVRGERACTLAATHYLLGDALCDRALFPVLDAVAASARYQRAEGLPVGFTTASLEPAHSPIPNWADIAAASYPAHAVAGMRARAAASLNAAARGKRSVADLAEDVVDATAKALAEAKQAAAAERQQRAEGDASDWEDMADREAVAPTLDGGDPEREWAAHQRVPPTPLPDGESSDEEDAAVAPPAEGEAAGAAGGDGSGLLPRLPPDAARLPIAAHMDRLLASVDSHTVTCVQGETGCGKSTAVPLALLLRHRDACARAVASGTFRSAAEAARAHPLQVVVTQPRRIAARSVAQRVASLLGEPVGRSIGYRVSMEGAGRLFGCSIMFVTTGYLLQVLTHQRDALGRLTHLVLDEVHERGVDADLLAMLIRTRMRVALRHRAHAAAAAAASDGARDGTRDDSGPAALARAMVAKHSDHVPRLVVMSATLQADKFAQYMRPVTVSVRGRYCRDGGLQTERLFLSPGAAAQPPHGEAPPVRQESAACMGGPVPPPEVRAPQQAPAGPLAPLLALPPLRGRNLGSTLLRAAGLAGGAGMTTAEVAIPKLGGGRSTRLSVTVHEAFRLVPWPALLAWARTVCPTFHTACCEWQRSRKVAGAAKAVANALSSKAVQQLLRATAGPRGHVTPVALAAGKKQAPPSGALLPGGLELSLGADRVELSTRLSTAALRAAAKRSSVTLPLPKAGAGEKTETSRPLVTVTAVGKCSAPDLTAGGARVAAALLSLPFPLLASPSRPLLPAGERPALAASLWQWSRREALAPAATPDRAVEAVLTVLRGAALAGPSPAARDVFSPASGIVSLDVELLPAFCALDWPAIVAGTACATPAVLKALEALAALRGDSTTHDGDHDKLLRTLFIAMSKGKAAKAGRKHEGTMWPLPTSGAPAPTAASARPIALSATVEPVGEAEDALSGGTTASGGGGGGGGTAPAPRRWQWVLRASVTRASLLQPLTKAARKRVTASCTALCIPDCRLAVPLVRVALCGGGGDDGALLREIGPFVAASLLARADEPAPGPSRPASAPQRGGASIRRGDAPGVVTPASTLATVAPPQLQVGAHRYPVQTLFLEDVLQLFPAVVSGLAVKERRDVEACCRASKAATDKARRKCGVAARGTGDDGTAWEAVVQEQRPLVQTKGTGTPRNVLSGLVASTIVALLRLRREPCILAFMPGMLDIMDVCAKLERALRPDEAEVVDVIALHSMVPKEEKDAAFVPAEGGRCKVVVATNIAESSITIPDATVVVDAGLQKELVFDQRKGLMRLDVTAASQASAAQRAGRVGRVGPGLCLRLFTRAHYLLAAERFDLPEIGRIPLDQVVLRLRRTPQLGPVHVALSLLPDPPLDTTLQSACDALHRAGALAAPRDDARVTAFGRFASASPCSVPMARVVYAALFLGCGAQTCVAVAAMGLQDVWAIPFPRFAPSPEAFASQSLRVAQSRAAHDGGHLSDPAALLSLFLAWVASQQSSRDAVALGVSYTRTRQWVGLASLIAHSALSAVSEEAREAVEDERATAAGGRVPRQRRRGSESSADPVEAALARRLGEGGLRALRALAGLQRRGPAPTVSAGADSSLSSPAACRRELARSFTQDDAMDRLRMALLVGGGSDAFAVGSVTASTPGLGPIWQGAPMPHAALKPASDTQLRGRLPALLQHTLFGVSVAKKPDLLQRHLLRVAEQLALILRCAAAMDSADAGGAEGKKARKAKKAKKAKKGKKDKAAASANAAWNTAVDALWQIQQENAAATHVRIPVTRGSGGGSTLRRAAAAAAEAVAGTPQVAAFLCPCGGKLGTLSLLGLAHAVVQGDAGKKKTAATVLCAPPFHPDHTAARTLLPLPPLDRESQASPPSRLWEQFFDGTRAGTPLPRTGSRSGDAPPSSAAELAAAWNRGRGCFPSALLPAPPQLHAAARMMRNPPDQGMCLPEDPLPPGARRLAPVGELVKVGSASLSSSLKLSARVRDDAGAPKAAAREMLRGAVETDGEAASDGEDEDESGRKEESDLDAAIDLVDLAAAKEAEEEEAGSAVPCPTARASDFVTVQASLDQRSYTASVLTASETPTPVLVVPGTMSLRDKKSVQLGCPTLFDLSQASTAAALLLAWNEISTSLQLLVGSVTGGGRDSDGATPRALTRGALIVTAVRVNDVTAELVCPARIDVGLINDFRQAMSSAQPLASAWDAARCVLLDAGSNVQVPRATKWARVVSCPVAEGGEPRLLHPLGLKL